MWKVLTNQNLWIAIFVWGLFWILAPLVPREDLFDLVNAIAVFTGIGVLIAYGPGAWRSLQLEQKDIQPGHYLVLGVITVCIGFTAHRVWQWVWRWFDKPAWMPDALFVAWFIWIIATGYAVHLTSVGAIDGQIPGKNWVKLGIYITLGLIAGSIAIIIVN